MSAQPKGRNLDDYVSVAERIERFYEKHPTGRIIPEIISHNYELGIVVMKASVYRNLDDAEPSAVGHAIETSTSGYVNKQGFHLENCETSAVGRALAMLGLEVKRGIASREEMRRSERAERNRPQAVQSEAATPASKSARAKTMSELVTPKQLVAIRSIANAAKVNAEDECARLYGCKPNELSLKTASEFIAYLKTLPDALTPAQQINTINQEKLAATNTPLDRDAVIAEFNEVKKALKSAGHPQFQNAIRFKLFVRETIRGFKGWMVQVDPETINGIDDMETALIADITNTWRKTLETFKPIEKQETDDDVF